MARLITWVVISLAVFSVSSLAALPLVAENAADRLDIPRAPGLPEPPDKTAPHAKPAMPVEELHEALRLPRVDASPTDKHSRASLAAYEAGDYETAFEEAVLALDPMPLEENELYRALLIGGMKDDSAMVEKSNGREANGAIDEALRSVREAEDSDAAARLNNAAAMFILYLYEFDPAMLPEDPYVVEAAGELAYQAADLQPDYCPAILNLTLFDDVAHASVYDLAPSGDPLNYSGGCLRSRTPTRKESSRSPAGSAATCPGGTSEPDKGRGHHGKEVREMRILL